MARTSMRGIPDRSFQVKAAALGQLDLNGRRLAVIGGTDGLGRSIARLAASRGARVTVVGRTFRDEGTGGIDFVRADLSSMREARRLGRELDVKGLDVTVLTTGIMAAPRREVTAEGIERDLAISYLSRLALVRELAPRLEATPRGAPRVFVMGFPGTGQLGDVDDFDGSKRYAAFAVHMNTVAGNEALVHDARARFPKVLFFGLNPGLVKTKIRSNFMGEGSLRYRAVEALIGLVTPSADRYAERMVPILFAPELEGHSGKMFGAKGQPILPTEGMTEAHVAKLIAASDALMRGVA